MNKEHYTHICERFNLTQYHRANGPEMWREEREGLVQNIVVTDINGSWFLRDNRVGCCLFGSLPSEHLAKEVLWYIEETKLLFI